MFSNSAFKITPKKHIRELEKSNNQKENESQKPGRQEQKFHADNKFDEFQRRIPQTKVSGAQTPKLIELLDHVTSRSLRDYDKLRRRTPANLKLSLFTRDFLLAGVFE
jgi:hypothetical protein